ncbi:Ppx/GppA phosphatase family protein [Kocuria sp.]|uniref:Ppx/GppA phosphatase family protein n=1 Tax=Kocuria sp. TaxID=1871328 RepID=UPI0026E02C42|nr:Ppx/GppA phosphatase family protein [Kocuria sp.]MDO5617539.1 Ppx/GppA phosphatase family protein [Kocuria sp.]
MRVGAIDCGTNSIRLLIADVGNGGGADGTAPTLTDVVRLNTIVRLGQGVDATGWLAQEALDRTFAATEHYSDLLQEHGVDALRFVATSATRDAGNRHVFVEGIRQRLGVDPEVISGDEEAALSFAGASLVAPATGADDRVLVVDLGGGSTEFVLGSADGIMAARSVDIGCVRMTERHLGSNPPTAMQQQAVLEDVDRAVDHVMQSVPLDQTRTLVGVAGSVTTITAHALGLGEYDPEKLNAAVLDDQQIVRACRELTEMTREQRAELPFMHPGRVDVIGGGALVWQRIVERVTQATSGRVHSATTSEHDILDGIALSLITD